MQLLSSPKIVVDLVSQKLAVEIDVLFKLCRSRCLCDALDSMSKGDFADAAHQLRAAAAADPLFGDECAALAERAQGLVTA